jgi:hypothetical protein
MGSESKKRWEAENYTQIKVAVPKEVAGEFSAYCTERGVSVRGEILRFMESRTAQGKQRAENKLQSPASTRPKRRKAVNELCMRLESILNAEQEYIGKIPENLMNSIVYERAEETVSALEEALGLLSEAY